MQKLKEAARLILETGNASTFILNNRDFIPTVIPSDFITLFDEIIKEGYKIEDVKVLTNKILNIFHAPVSKYKITDPGPDSFLGILIQNNIEMELVLKKIRPVFKAFNKDPGNSELKAELTVLFENLALFVRHYTIKENVLFPVLEKSWPDYRCLQIMWSFHDDIRRNIKTVLILLDKEVIDLKKFNRIVGDIFFNMLAIKFREEKILFPHILSTISEKDLEIMNQEGLETGYPYIKPAERVVRGNNIEANDSPANLGTGILSIEQIKLIFNHLPVDITFVDENDKVRYYSSPAERIFPRTTAVIGRDVSNCHPPESVNVVKRIVDSFKNGEKNYADFRIRMKGKLIFIRYFAVRNENGIYKGVLEVTQEISGIQAFEGEKRLLDW